MPKYFLDVFENYRYNYQRIFSYFIHLKTVQVLRKEIYLSTLQMHMNG